MTLLKRANKYIDETMPWALAKDENEKERLATVIYNLLETIRIATIMLSSIIPSSSEKIMQIFKGVSFDWESAKTFGVLPAGTEIGELDILFARIDEDKMLKQIFEDNQKKQKEKEKELKKEENRSPFGELPLSLVRFRTAPPRTGVPAPRWSRNRSGRCPPLPRARWRW